MEVFPLDGCANRDARETKLGDDPTNFARCKRGVLKRDSAKADEAFGRDMDCSGYLVVLVLRQFEHGMRREAVGEGYWKRREHLNSNPLSIHILEAVFRLPAAIINAAGMFPSVVD